MQYLQITNKRHISYMESLDNMEEIQWATLEFQSRVNDKFKFNQGVEEWIASFTVQTFLSLDDIRPRDSLGHHSASKTKSRQRWSSRLSVKIVGVKVKQAVSKLRLQQAKKRLELKKRCETLLRQQELLYAQNDKETATLEARILEASIKEKRFLVHRR